MSYNWRNVMSITKRQMSYNIMCVLILFVCVCVCKETHESVCPKLETCVCTNLVCAKTLTKYDAQQRYTHALVYSKAGNLGAWTSNRQQRIRIVLGLRVPKEPRTRQLPSALDGGWLALGFSNIELYDLPHTCIFFLKLNTQTLNYMCF